MTRPGGDALMITEGSLAAAVDGFLYITSAPPFGEEPGTPVEIDDAGAFARALFARLRHVAGPDGIVDAHVCCEHAGDAPGPFADPEVAAMAALATVLPLVSALGHDARERVMSWARMRATDGLPPF